MARKKKSVSNLLITGIADKGKAVGKTNEGEVIFVDQAVPGDVVDVLVLRKKKTYSEAVVKNFVQYSPDRIQAECMHFGVCGGCKYQNLSYEAQLKNKFQTVKDCMRRIGKLDPELVLPIIGCQENIRYRNKLEYSFSSKRWITKEEAASDIDIHQIGALGFHRPGSYDKIVDIESCLLQDDLSNVIRNAIRNYAHQHQLSFYDIKNQTGLLRNMIVRNTSLGEWMVILIFGHDDKTVIEPLLEMLKTNFPHISLFYVINTKVNDTIFDLKVQLYHGMPYIVEQLKNIKYQIGPKSFFQTNPKQAITLFDIAVGFADLKPTDIVYDLYTGLGSIALYIAASVKNVIGIEEVPEAIVDAKVNMDFNQIKNASFYAGDVKDIFNEAFIQRHGKADVIITDPPRSGMHEDVISTILKLETKKIVYISCNPATQARDLKLLSTKYDVVAIQTVDMFPHTHHIECVAQLHLKASYEPN